MRNHLEKGQRHPLRDSGAAVGHGGITTCPHHTTSSSSSDTSAAFRAFEELEEGHLNAGGMEPDVVAEHEHDPAEKCQVVAD